MAGCAVGPNYKRPGVAAPARFRGGEPNPTKISLGDVRWFDLFQDDTLRGLIAEALRANFDINIASQRVIEAEGRFIATRSSLFPHLNGQADSTRTGFGSPISSEGRVFGYASWEVDIFGKLRRATEAARADMLASEDTQLAVMQMVVADVAIAYFNLLELDAEIAYVRESIKTRQQSLELVIAREIGGVSSMLDVDQAKNLVETAQAQLVPLEKLQEQTENLIQFLLGKPPGPVARGRKLTEEALPLAVPAGLPSALLERRPDLQAAEEQLVAANARVGVAKAAFFPTITLTAAGGVATADLLGIANRSGSAYLMQGLLDVPIFDAGRRQGDYKTAKATYREYLWEYLKAVDGAFRDVSDALIGYQKTREYTAAQTRLTETLRDQSLRANQRYVGGVSSYLEVLDTERQRLTAEEELIRAQRDVLTALVGLYKSLGGGWQ
jgi:multidrug efflux system outer membrane protein